jgi:hypothetical protein
VAIKLVDIEVFEFTEAAGDGVKGAEAPDALEAPEAPEATEATEAKEAMGVGGEIEFDEGEADLALETPPAPPLIKVGILLFGKLGAVEMGFVGLETDGGEVDEDVLEVIGVPETVFGGFVTGFEEVLLTGGP